MNQSALTEKLLQDLQHVDPRVRRLAAKDLGQLSPPERRIVGALSVAANTDANEVVRTVAAQTYRDLTGHEPPQTYSIIDSAAAFVLAAGLTSVLNGAVLYIEQLRTFGSSVM